MSLVTVCHCGHDLATHYDKKHACTGIGCDPECRMFIDRDEPDRPERTQKTTPLRPISFDDAWDRQKPHTDTNCQCDACLEWCKRRRYPHWP